MRSYTIRLICGWITTTSTLHILRLHGACQCTVIVDYYNVDAAHI